MTNVFIATVVAALKCFVRKKTEIDLLTKGSKGISYDQDIELQWGATGISCIATS
jgi:hypothetical protein